MVCGALADQAGIAEREIGIPSQLERGVELCREGEVVKLDARDGEGLTRLVETIEVMKARHGEGPILAAAGLVAEAALARRESRGAHYRTDYPLSAEPPTRTFLTHPGQQALRVAAE